MTARLTRGQGHTYKLDGFRVPSVTGIIGVLDKPALVGWAAKVSAEYVVDQWDALQTMSPIDRYEAVKGARFDVNRKATEKGKRIHALGEKLAHGLEVDVPAEFRSEVDAYARFLDLWELEVVLSEAAVASSDHRYAGTLDWCYRSPRLGLILGDTKTGKGIYPEVALQLGGYDGCDLRLEDRVEVGPRGGQKKVSEERPFDLEIDGYFVAHVQSDAVALHPVKITEQTRDAFLYARELWEWKDVVGNEKGNDYDPPVDEAIFPEQYPILEAAS